MNRKNGGAVLKDLCNYRLTRLLLADVETASGNLAEADLYEYASG